jgi:hypothetical protein
MSLKAALSNEKSGVFVEISAKQKNDILFAMSDVLQENIRRSSSVLNTAKYILKLLLRIMKNCCQIAYNKKMNFCKV